MKIVYIVNSCEHEVWPYCDGLYKEFGDGFKFLDIVEMGPAHAAKLYLTLER